MIRPLLLAALASGCFVSGAVLSQEAAPAAKPPGATAPATQTAAATPPATPQSAPGASASPAGDAGVGTPQRATPAATVPLVPASVGAAPAATSLLQTIVALLVVLGTLIGLAWALKRFGPRPAAGMSNLHIVGALNLGGRERIVVVEVGDQWIVVGASPGRINALATMPRQEGIAASALDAANAPQVPNFAQWLKQTIEKRNAK